MNKNKDILNEKFELSERQTSVFLLRLNDYDHEQLYSFLSSDEKQRADRLKVELKKKQFIVSRSALRKILSNSIDIPNDEVNFYYSEHGKPFIENKYNNKAIEFNISHSDQCILIAISMKNQLGVDIEKINTEINYESLSKRFFSERENEYFRNIEPDKQLDTFYAIWTRKEAFIKATGQGIAYGLDKFSVATDRILRSKVEFESKEKNCKEWFCFDLMKVEHYKTALCTDNVEIELIFYQ